MRGIEIVDEGPMTGPVAFGRRRLIEALGSAAVEPSSARSDPFVRIGMSADRAVAQLLGPTRVQPEGVLLRRCRDNGRTACVIAGSDERGLMYALNEMADRVRASGPAALEIAEGVEEYPVHCVRGVDRYVQGHLDEEWLFSEPFWRYFLGRLAVCRFNRFVLIMGFDTAFLTPPYPFLVDVPGFSHVHAVDPAQREKNLSQLRRIGALCHEHGLEYVLGTWQQTPWTKAQKVMVEGLPKDEQELSAYCAAGLRELVRRCDTADGLQLRVNFEAGVGSQRSSDAFWKRIVEAAASAGRRVKLDIRAKGLSDDLLRFALESGLELSVPTKHWCEHTGLPYHLTRMRTEELERLDNHNHSRRYSYADLLRKPRRFDVVYRLWMYGSTCLFAWGDPDHARRFSESCLLGGAGFEIDAALSLKGGHEMLQGEPWSIHKDASLRSAAWEDERYFMRYLVLGRLGYSTATDPSVWRRELARRFGEASAPHIEAAYAAAGKVMPIITASHMPAHPSQWYWPEMSTGGALFEEHQHNAHFGRVTYGAAEPSDPGLFYGIDEYVTDVLAGKVIGKYTPLQVRGWLAKLAGDIRAALRRAEESGMTDEHLEYRQTAIDFRMLAWMAEYHVYKAGAALHLSRYARTDDVEVLARAIACMGEALGAWRRLADEGRVYHDNLELGQGAGTDRHGHWRDRIPELERDLERLRRMLVERHGVRLTAEREREIREAAPALASPAWPEAPAWNVDWPERSRDGQDIVVTVRPREEIRGEVHVRYRHTNQLEGEWRTAIAEPRDGALRAVIPGSYVERAWDMLVYVVAVEGERGPRMFPGLYHAEHAAPYHRVEVV